MSEIPSPVEIERWVAQASIGPGMGVYSKFAQVLRQDGKPVTDASTRAYGCTLKYPRTST